MPNVKTIDMPAETVSEWLSYAPDTGFFYWKKKPARNVRAGDRAGTFKANRAKNKKYLYIRLANYELTGARVAWVLHYGVWPEGNVLYRDGDTTNLKIDNLVEAQFTRTVIHENGLKKRIVTREAQRHYGLKRYYGMSLAEYNVMLKAQDGVCAICKKVDTAIIQGEPKPLAVDHNHTTGVIRGLLCSPCNQSIGLFKEDPEILDVAAAYLRSHGA